MIGRRIGRGAILGFVMGSMLLGGMVSRAAAQKVEAALASPNNPEIILVRAMTMFASKVGEKTKGNVAVKVVHSGQLGGMKENFESIMAGNLEMAQVNNAFLANLHPATALFDLPFLFRDNEHMKKVVRGPLGQQVYADLEKKTGIRLFMTGLPDGPRSVWNRRRAVRVPDDLKGIKLRVMQGPLMVDTFKALGAIPTPMPFPEVYMAAKQGVIDGAEQPPFGVVELKANEVAKYYSLTKHFAMPSALGISVKWLNGLSKEHQQAIQDAADEARAWYDAQYAAEDAAALVEIKKRGMEINETDIELFRAAVKPVYEKYADQVGGWKLIQAVLDTK